MTRSGMAISTPGTPSDCKLLLCLQTKNEAMSHQSKKEKRNKRKKKAEKAARTYQHVQNIRKKKQIDIRKFGKIISERQFAAYCYSRLPQLRFIGEEKEWYSLFDNKLLGIVLRDKTDNGYGYLILGRDRRRLFRCIKVGSKFHPSVPQARQALAIDLAENYQGKVQDIYPQYDEIEPTLDLFSPTIPENLQHHGYKILACEPRYEAARNLVSEIANSFIDNDGHYKREFQSENFNSRLWELYLHIYFHNAGLLIENNHSAPDFELSFFGAKCFVEAVTVNPSQNAARPDPPPPKSTEEITERLDGFMPIKFGSPLYSKLKHGYWNLDHVKGYPLVLAVHDFHNETSMTWSRTALSEYLYGVRAKVVKGQPVEEKIEQHEWQGKVIESGFFKQKDSENISAVLFSNQATLPKFNRMGKLAGLGSKDIGMLRHGFLYNPDPEAYEAIPFTKNVDDADYAESWSDGLIMFHNPYAKIPVNPDLFHDISHVMYSDEHGFTGYHQPYDVLGSVTIVVEPKD